MENTIPIVSCLFSKHITAYKNDSSEIKNKYKGKPFHYFYIRGTINCLVNNTVGIYDSDGSVAIRFDDVIHFPWRDTLQKGMVITVMCYIKNVIPDAQTKLVHSEFWAFRLCPWEGMTDNQWQQALSEFDERWTRRSAPAAGSPDVGDELIEID